jgi:hypothetical protein
MRPYGPTPEERLRDALRAQADEVETAPDALPMIRMRTARDRRRTGWAMFGAAAAVATAVAAGAVVVAGDRAGPPPVPGASASGPSGEPGPTGTTGRPGKATVNLPVYFARNGRLYREFRPVTLSPDGDVERIRAAVAMALRGESADPDYRTLWPAGATVRSVAVDGARVTVDLTGAGPVGGSADLAVQQLVYTASAAATYTSIKRSDGVRILADGAETGGVLRQAPMVDVQAPVWVIEPAQGAEVGKTFTVYLAGIVFEGTVNLRIRGPGGRLVDERVVQLSAGAPALGEARVPVTLPSGPYTVEAYYLSPQDGSVQWVDDHDFTVG